MKKKDIIGLQRQNKTKINPHCGVKMDYWTHEVRHIKSFAPNQRKNYIFKSVQVQTHIRLTAIFLGH